MAHRLPSLTRGCIARWALGGLCGLLVVVAAQFSSAQQPVLRHSTSDVIPANVPIKAREAVLTDARFANLSGNELIELASQNLAEMKSLECRLRQRIDAFDQQLVGAGTYLQFGVGDERRLRLELKLQVGNRLSSIQQICDSRRLWVRRDFPDGQSLMRIDLRRAREAALEAGGGDATVGVNSLGGAWLNAAWLEGGGLPCLIESLAANFNFTAGESSFSRSDGEARLSAVVLHGRWKPERLQSLRASHKAAKKKVGSFSSSPTPDRVAVTLGNNEHFTLFPYRIEYFLAPETAQEGRAGQGRVGEGKLLCGLEFYELRRVAHADPRQFEYLPGEQEVIDGTEAYIARWTSAK